jgi:hypothetical protein
MGIFSKIFGRGSAEAQKAPVLSNAEVEAVINAYGGVLAEGKAGSGIIVDSKALPYPKSTIRAALQIALRDSADVQMKEFLKVAYVSLADFQEGVGPKPIGMNLLGIDLNSDPSDLAKALANQDPIVAKLQRIADAEMQDLKRELIGAGLW